MRIVNVVGQIRTMKLTTLSSNQLRAFLRWAVIEEIEFGVERVPSVARGAIGPWPTTARCGDNCCWDEDFNQVLNFWGRGARVISKAVRCVAADRSRMSQVTTREKRYEATLPRCWHAGRHIGRVISRDWSWLECRQARRLEARDAGRRHCWLRRWEQRGHVSWHRSWRASWLSSWQRCRYRRRLSRWKWTWLGCWKRCRDRRWHWRG